MCIDPTLPDILVSSADMEQDLWHAARLDVPVLISGHGPDQGAQLAHLIHRTSLRASGRFVNVSCASTSPATLEATLFGTPADPGLLERADGGTLLLEDVDTMTTELQVRLLEFLDSGEIRVAGGERAHTTASVRMIASTTRNLFSDVRRRQFHQELFYRLNVIHIIPPARDLAS